MTAYSDITVNSISHTLVLPAQVMVCPSLTLCGGIFGGFGTDVLKDLYKECKSHASNLIFHKKKFKKLSTDRGFEEHKEWYTAKSRGR